MSSGYVGVSCGAHKRGRRIASALRLLAVAGTLLLIGAGPAAAQLREAAFQASPALADLVVVDKSARTLQVLQRGRVLREYRVALGRRPTGHKEQQGDGRTPEGMYRLDRLIPNSAFHRGLGISYPSARDEARAAARGVDPGGAIVLHGLPNGYDASAVGHPVRDWTNGCIAVTNDEIEEILTMVAPGTPIWIQP